MKTKKVYDVIWVDDKKTTKVYKCYAERKANEVAKWFEEHMGAANPTVKENDCNATGAIVVRL